MANDSKTWRCGKYEYAKEMKELDAACETAMAQIKNKRYDEALRDEGQIGRAHV